MRSPAVRSFTAVVAMACWLSAAAGATQAGFPTFTPRVIDPHCGEVCYAVTAADVDGDGRQDIVAVTENRVLWYQALGAGLPTPPKRPTAGLPPRDGRRAPPEGWSVGRVSRPGDHHTALAPRFNRRVIIEDQTVRDNVCIAPHDVDGDGKIDFALGAGWTKVGTIQWLSRGKSLDEKWHVHLIGEERWLHRMRFADVLGRGEPQLVISPLNATGGRKGVRLTAFEIPADPKTDRWKPHVMDATLNRMHNHWHADLDGDGTTDTLTASAEGVHLIRRSGDEWTRTKLAAGASGKQPSESGAGEIKTGQLKGGRAFIATIEPMHGNMLAIYTPPPQKAGDAGLSERPWHRRVIENSLQRGHALWAADLDGDGADELVVGHSHTRAGENLPRGLYVFDCLDAKGEKWEKHVLDEGGIAVEDAVVADFTGDGRPDIVAGGRYTHNVKLYVNRPR